MTKNRIEVWQAGKIIEIKITASNDEMADKIFDLIEVFSTTAFRIDLEREWRSDHR